MSFVRAWLAPRVAFWLIWTAWLWALQSFLLARFAALPGHPVLLLVVAPPILLAWIGSRFCRHPLDSPNALFWKGTALSCLLAAFDTMFLLLRTGWEFYLLIAAALITAYLGIRAPRSRKVTLTQGELFDRAQWIARRAGATVTRVIVFRRENDLPNAFAQRHTNTILLSDRLLRILSRAETEAVIAHEVSHLRPQQRMAVSAVPLLVAFCILLNGFWPAAKLAMPFLPLVSVLLWRALRRRHEYDADASAVRATGDPAALIAALTRISSETGMPYHWGPVAGFFLTHPPMSARFRSLARKSGMPVEKLDEIVASVGVVPPLPGFDSPFGPVQAAEGILDALRRRTSLRLGLLSRSFPILAGVGFAAFERSQGSDLLTLVEHAAAWTLAAMLVYWATYETIAGSERRRLRDQLPGARTAGNTFVGIAAAAEPRYYQGLYHYDLGLARIDGGSLCFAGTRCSFAIGCSDALRVWIARGPRHWTPRKIVCVEYRMESGETGIVSFQSLERWFWPATSSAARDLLSTLTQWSASGKPAAIPSVPPPQDPGALLPYVGLGAVWKAARLACAIAFCASWLVIQSALLTGALATFAVPFVTGALVLFVFSPHLEPAKVRAAQTPSAQVR